MSLAGVEALLLCLMSVKASVLPPFLRPITCRITNLYSTSSCTRKSFVPGSYVANHKFVTATQSQCALIMLRSMAHSIVFTQDSLKSEPSIFTHHTVLAAS
jgi:hypothetical protein